MFQVIKEWDELLVKDTAKWTKHRENKTSVERLVKDAHILRMESLHRLKTISESRLLDVESVRASSLSDLTLTEGGCSEVKKEVAEAIALVFSNLSNHQIETYFACNLLHGGDLRSMLPPLFAAGKKHGLVICCPRHQKVLLNIKEVTVIANVYTADQVTYNLIKNGRRVPLRLYLPEVIKKSSAPPALFTLGGSSGLVGATAETLKSFPDPPPPPETERTVYEVFNEGWKKQHVFELNDLPIRLGGKKKAQKKHVNIHPWPRVEKTPYYRPSYPRPPDDKKSRRRQRNSGSEDDDMGIDITSQDTVNEDDEDDEEYEDDEDDEEKKEGDGSSSKSSSGSSSGSSRGSSSGRKKVTARKKRKPKVIEVDDENPETNKNRQKNKLDVPQIFQHLLLENPPRKIQPHIIAFITRCMFAAAPFTTALNSIVTTDNNVMTELKDSLMNMINNTTQMTFNVNTLLQNLTMKNFDDPIDVVFDTFLNELKDETLKDIFKYEFTRKPKCIDHDDELSLIKTTNVIRITQPSIEKDINKRFESFNEDNSELLFLSKENCNICKQKIEYSDTVKSIGAVLVVYTNKNTSQAPWTDPAPIIKYKDDTFILVSFCAHVVLDSYRCFVNTQKGWYCINKSDVVNGLEGWEQEKKSIKSVLLFYVKGYKKEHKSVTQPREKKDTKWQDEKIIVATTFKYDKELEKPNDSSHEKNSHYNTSRGLFDKTPIDDLLHPNLIILQTKLEEFKKSRNEANELLNTCLAKKDYTSSDYIDAKTMKKTCTEAQLKILSQLLDTCYLSEEYNTQFIELSETEGRWEDAFDQCETWYKDCWEADDLDLFNAAKQLRTELKENFEYPGQIQDTITKITSMTGEKLRDELETLKLKFTKDTCMFRTDRNKIPPWLVNDMVRAYQNLALESFSKKDYAHLCDDLDCAMDVYPSKSSLILTNFLKQEVLTTEENKKNLLAAWGSSHSKKGLDIIKKILDQPSSTHTPSPKPVPELLPKPVPELLPSPPPTPPPQPTESKIDEALLTQVDTTLYNNLRVDKLSRGLSNKNAITCYVNSVIQCMFGVKPIQNYITVNTKSDFIADDSDEYVIYEKLQQIFKELKQTDNALEIDEFQNFLLEKQIRCVQGQDDAGNFCLLFFEQLPVLAKKITFKQLVKSTCTTCKNVEKDQVQNLLCLTPAHVQKANFADEIHNALNSTTTLQIDSDRKEKHGSPVCIAQEREVHIEILTFPDVLLITVAMERGSRKMHHQETIPLVIVIEIQGETQTYVLVSFCFHIGETNSGHYVGCVNTKDGWYTANDSTITKGLDTWRHLEYPFPTLLFYVKV